MSNRIRWSLAISAFVVVLLGLWRVRAQEDQPHVVPSKFTFARIAYSTPDFGSFRGRRFEPPWSHDYPRSERNFAKILAEVTKIDVNSEGHIVTFETDEAFKFPIAYLCEVGFLDLSEQERRNMSEYLLRGGFLIVDDFRGEQALYNFMEQMRLVFPDRVLEQLPRTHPIFNCFYDISDLFPPPPPVYNRFDRSLVPQYLGMSDDKGRLMMVVDYNNDLSDYWEWSDDPFQPIEETNEAYKYGVNYVMYALTH